VLYAEMGDDEPPEQEQEAQEEGAQDEAREALAGP
jgi:hypothetical protein